MSDQVLREHVLYLLKGGGAHLSFGQAIEDLPEKLRGAKVDGVPHTAWRLLEHLRLCQWDILEFSQNSEHVSPPFPEGYWPETDAPPDAEAWDRSVQAFQTDLRAMIDWVADPSANLLAPSISTALAMTYAGAEGETESQMADVLHFADDQSQLPRESLHEAFGALSKLLNSDEKQDAYQLSMANRLWGQKTFPFVPEFLETTRKNYGAESSEV